MASHDAGISFATTSAAEATPPAITALSAEFYTQFLSDSAKARKPSPIRGLLPLEATPGIISLLAGKPNAISFPISSLTFNARSPSNSLGEGAETTLEVPAAALADGLQYGPTAGYAPLVEWFTGLQEYEHKRRRDEGWRISVGLGSQDLIYKAINATVNPGDAVLVESPMYAGVIQLFQALNCELHEVETDAEGISSQSLRNILENWPENKQKPKVLYSVPYGCNPTGMTATISRRKETMELAREHNFLILEDDPYYYLYYGKAERVPSYLTLERQVLPEVGRVIRFDSLSKILSAGIRIGFVTGPRAIIDVMDLHTAAANLQPPGLTQSIAYTLLNHWGYDAFLQHTRNVSAFYGEKCAIFDRAMRTHLSGLAEWTTPESGMFFWFKLLLPEGPNANDSEAIIRTHAFERGVLALPGAVFIPGGHKTSYVRAAFSLLEPDQVEEACKRLAATLREIQ